MKVFKRIFFPEGNYNKKLYKKYITYSFISNIFVGMESSIATHNMLNTININNDVTRTFNYIGKDVIGQMGGMLYMARLSKNADKKPKKFLLFSNIIQQLSFVMICFTPITPEYFLPIAGAANILTNLSFVGIGAINAKCICNLSEDNNVGELYAKISMVNMLSSSTGLMSGLYIISALPDYISKISILPILAILRIYTFNKAVEDII